MNEKTLQQIETRCNAATQGPWVTGSIPWKVWAYGGKNTVCDVGACGDSVPVPGTGLAVSNSMAHNRDFIAAARTDIPLLIAALREAWKRIEIYENENTRTN